MTYVTRHIDWLAVSFPKIQDARNLWPGWSWAFKGRGNHGYKSAYEERSNHATLQQDSDNPEMGAFIQFSGSALQDVRESHNGDDLWLVNSLARLDGKASRIDLAINIHDGTLTPAILRDMLEDGRVKTPAKAWRFVSGKRGDVSGDTLYIGSPQSDVQLRCYDKAAERGIKNGEAWIRLEAELRRYSARSAFRSCADNGVGATCTGCISHVCACNHADFTVAYHGANARPERESRTDANRVKWLCGQCATALAREWIVNPDILERFNKALASEMARLTREQKSRKM
jgi:hypothetical protein